ncbi:epididymal-specific lipocalin-8 isoform X1 [Balaenoptera ricei]|uniref:epididymal-specific lipocalin-8 isoform X1 n=1 Tax=Balaenoptera ricei TaxID=2746895 RepID=UPI0028BE3D4D|nr:epididymal-specific lipocalin-8 isoform X1 [Balaenoptera ricei]
MEAGLLSAVLGIILLQVEMTAQDLDLQKIAGFWREVGVASSQYLALQTPKRLEALFLTLSGEELTVKAAYNSSGSCETEQIVSSEVNVSGRFVFPGHREIQVIDTDYEQFAILRVSLHWRDKEFHVLKYFTRSLEGEYEPGFWKFRELTADTGLYLVARHGADLEEPLPPSGMLGAPPTQPPLTAQPWGARLHLL